MNTKQLDGIAEVVAEVVREAVQGLEKRVADLEQCGIKFCGTHQRAIEYGRGSVVTSNGASWVALKTNPVGLPGDSPDWGLMARAGRDAR